MNRRMEGEEGKDIDRARVVVVESRQSDKSWDTIPGVLTTLTFPPDFAPFPQILIVPTFRLLGGILALVCYLSPGPETCFGKWLGVEERSWLWIQKVLSLNCVGSWGIYLTLQNPIFLSILQESFVD